MAEKYDIVAATGCPTGIAHTFMAKEALEKAAAERGLTIKVETHGQVGVENELTAAEIAGEWTHPYTRAEAAFPLAWVREAKFFPYVTKIDNGYGDRNLCCRNCE